MCKHLIAGTTDGRNFAGSAIDSVLKAKNTVDICPR
jgi:hypothetical protein